MTDRENDELTVYMLQKLVGGISAKTMEAKHAALEDVLRLIVGDDMPWVIRQLSGECVQ